MTDDILDAAQKAINDAASTAGTPVPTDASNAPASPPAAATPSPDAQTAPLPQEPAPAPMTDAPKIEEPKMKPAPVEAPASMPATPEPSVVPAMETPKPEEVPMAPSDPAPSVVPPANAAVDTAKEQMVSDVLKGPAETAAPMVVPPPDAEQKKPSGKVPGKRSGVKGILMAIIVAILLTLPAAVWFISKQNEPIADIRNRATSGEQTPYGGECTIGDPSTCPAGWECHCTGGNDCTGTQCVSPDWIQNVCISQGRSWCVNEYGFAMTCCAEGYVCVVNGNGCKPGGPTNPPTRPPGENPTNTPIPQTPVCQNIKIYKDGTQVSPDTLRAGDVVVLAVKGSMSPEKARFRVNGSAWTQTTEQNGSGEYTLEYTIPEGIADFVIEGEVYTSGAWR